MPPPLEIVPVAVLRDNYVWLVHDPGSGETVAVDPSVADPVLAAAEQRRWPLLSGAGLAAAVVTGSLAVLSQSPSGYSRGRDRGWADSNKR